MFRRLAKRIGGEAHTPELDNDSEPECTAALVVILRWYSLRVSPFAALAAFFNALQTDAFTAQNHHLTSDDLAMACEYAPATACSRLRMLIWSLYCSTDTFASTFQDASHFTGPPQLPRHQ